MDRERFDALARLFATTGSRRATIGALLGAGLFGAGLDTEAKNGKSKRRDGKGKAKDRGRDRGRGKDRGKSKGKDRKRNVRAEQLPANCCSTNPCTPGPGKNIGKCCFEDAVLVGQNFKGANAGSANFSGANLSNANFSGTNLGKACFVDAILTGAIINGSTNTGGAIFCRTTMPDGSINNSGCAKGTRCCPTCDVDNLCPTGQVCCDGRCRPGNCCTDANCTEPTETCCSGTCVDTDADPDNCGECGRDCEDDEICSNGFTCQDPDCLPVTEIEGDVELAPNGGLTLHAEPGGPPFVFGAFAFGVPSGTTFAQITSMETTFDFTEGDCGAGTPRFCVTFTNISSCACAQIPTDLCDEPSEAQGTSGNLIGNNTPGVWFKICSAAGPPINTYAEALAGFGAEEIDSIFMVADSSNGNQTVTVEPCVNVASIG